MISGFNTDVEFEGTTYHVQTEDKGLKTRKIISLVYDGGTILASKREAYDDMPLDKFDESVLAERVQRQHQLICAAVKAGRMSDLKEMSARAAARTQPKAVEVESQPETHPETAVVIETPQTTQQPVQVQVLEHGTTNGSADMPVARPVAPPEELPAEEIILKAPDIFADAPLFDAVTIVEDDMLPDDAVAVVSELSGKERPANSKLSLELLGETKFKGGDRRTVMIMVCRGTERKVIGNAEIMMKVLGSSFRPLIFHARSDANGLAKIHMQLPHFETGRAALLVRAINDGEEVELRRIVTPG